MLFQQYLSLHYYNRRQFINKSNFYLFSRYYKTRLLKFHHILHHVNNFSKLRLITVILFESWSRSWVCKLVQTTDRLSLTAPNWKPHIQIYLSLFDPTPRVHLDSPLELVYSVSFLRPYFGHLSCMPVVYMWHITNFQATNLILNQSVVEKLLPFVKLVSLSEGL